MAVAKAPGDGPQDPKMNLGSETTSETVLVNGNGHAVSNASSAPAAAAATTKVLGANGPASDSSAESKESPPPMLRANSRRLHDHNEEKEKAEGHLTCNGPMNGADDIGLYNNWSR
ncbi:amidophosphoribosyltransferase [Tilletia horrida]|uniref:Amidophosphoribosyltransferase n=1 Tax=Tilletia horrida TaxID=155126 RepID=A0AAN6GL91_9BASI|nr:amidophosphoribosyltransferase [Tilletia horrida]KAK0546553.1 amidophosphoribosyltransferase [Tilletia horrida]KAK0562326.1 amidophosphoribosyltransferase [Tilletia horrida]